MNVVKKFEPNSKEERVIACVMHRNYGSYALRGDLVDVPKSWIHKGTVYGRVGGQNGQIIDQALVPHDDPKAVKLRFDLSNNPASRKKLDSERAAMESRRRMAASAEQVLKQQDLASAAATVAAATAAIDADDDKPDPKKK